MSEQNGKAGKTNKFDSRAKKREKEISEESKDYGV